MSVSIHVHVWVYVSLFAQSYVLGAPWNGVTLPTVCASLVSVIGRGLPAAKAIASAAVTRLLVDDGE